MALSVDEAIWPSVCSLDDADGCGFFQSLWGDLGELRAHLGSRPPAQADVIAAAVELGGKGGSEWVTWENRLRGVSVGGASICTERDIPVANPATVERSWTFLGYDICDLWGTSGLNAIRAQARPAPDGARLPGLNSNLLVERVAHAFEYARIADIAIPEHAPFFAYGLWWIETHGT